MIYNKQKIILIKFTLYKDFIQRSTNLFYNHDIVIGYSKKIKK